MEKNQLIELQAYPEINFSWKEPGIAFRITFTPQSHLQQPEQQQESLYRSILKQLSEKPLNTSEISQRMGRKEISGQLRKVLRKLHKDQLVENTIPGSPNHPAQKHQLTREGRTFLERLTNV